MKAILTILLASATLPLFATSTVPEPETIFYGKILNNSGPQPYQMKAGDLQWSISRGESEALTFKENLAPQANGNYSYRLAIPHSALALDLDETPEALPLAGTDTSHRHLAITVNGHPATIITAGNAKFDVAQTKRASTYRLDLEVHFPLPDSDHDGMADWWEDRYGLDKQSDDSSDDLDHDGRTNLAEFLDGSDPTTDNRIPSLLTHTVIAAAEGLSGIYLQSRDSDTPPSRVEYTLTSVPAHGSLRLRDARRDPSNSDRELTAGATFTQADLNRGRLVYAPGIAERVDGFNVKLHDGESKHDPARGKITIALSQPEAGLLESGTAAERVELALGSAPLDGVDPAEEQRVRQFILARDGGYLHWDLSDLQHTATVAAASQGTNLVEYLNDYGPALPAVVTGGSANDVLQGGLASDLLAGGPGNDTLTGGSAGDRFVFLTTGDGDDVITDFNTSEDDLLDLSRVLQGDSHLLSDYLQVRSSLSDLVLAIDANGDGSGFTDLSVTLTGAAGPDLYDLWSSGHILTNGLTLPPRISIAASSAPARENGPTATEFTVTLGSPASTPLEVGLLVSGSATNGTDYARVPSSLTIPAGVTSISVPLAPYQDAITEPSETVLLELLAGSGYTLTSDSAAENTILDLLPELRVTALVPRAIQSSNTPGMFLIERSTIINRSVLVRLDISGTASMGSDYESISTFVNLAAGETTALVPVTPINGAELEFDAESVRMTIQPHSSYQVESQATAEIIIIDRETSLADWRTANFPDLDSLNLAEFLSLDSRNTGYSHLLRYAFALDPKRPVRSPHAFHPKVSLLDGHLTIEFTRLLTASDLRWTIESSTDLKTWTASSDLIEDVSASLASPDARRTRFRIREPAESGSQKYIRVRVTHQP